MSSFSLIDCLTIAFWSPGPFEMLLLAGVALLLYGGNLPEVARSWGKSFAEFRRGLSGFQSELNDVIYSEPEQLTYHQQPARDDTRFAAGYEDVDDQYEHDHGEHDHNEHDHIESDHGESSTHQSDAPSETAELDDSDQTVKDAGADTVVIDDNVEKPAD